MLSLLKQLYRFVGLLPPGARESCFDKLSMTFLYYF
jgi:hypothetical protein